MSEYGEDRNKSAVNDAVSNPSSATPDAADLTKFQLDILAAAGILEESDELSYGLAIKEQVELWYGKEVNHGRLYPNLDTLVEDGLIEKEEFDRRTNRVLLTDKGREVLQQRAALLASAVGQEVVSPALLTEAGQEQARSDD